ncbi:hypothetical protein BDV95DRAFT_332706 [Massariosphaeria phaeospora]|uniref:Uncharacterized protein n=1 Tax=Massariosphaeria phaeospora TaxID=100035 RepID=A0A7C8IC91_9PLEO|nr:hypothetical protein BDV95DRAFT_332706 [Massariosphaeria phaeospora]
MLCCAPVTLSPRAAGQCFPENIAARFSQLTQRSSRRINTTSTLNTSSYISLEIVGWKPSLNTMDNARARATRRTQGLGELPISVRLVITAVCFQMIRRLVSSLIKDTGLCIIIFLAVVAVVACCPQADEVSAQSDKGIISPQDQTLQEVEQLQTRDAGNKHVLEEVRFEGRPESDIQLTDMDGDEASQRSLSLVGAQQTRVSQVDDYLVQWIMYRIKFLYKPEKDRLQVLEYSLSDMADSQETISFSDSQAEKDIIMEVLRNCTNKEYAYLKNRWFWQRDGLYLFGPMVRHFVAQARQCWRPKEYFLSQTQHMDIIEGCFENLFYERPHKTEAYPNERRAFEELERKSRKEREALSDIEYREMRSDRVYDWMFTIHEDEEDRQDEASLLKAVHLFNDCVCGKYSCEAVWEYQDNPEPGTDYTFTGEKWARPQCDHEHNERVMKAPSGYMRAHQSAPLLVSLQDCALHLSETTHDSDHWFLLGSSHNVHERIQDVRKAQGSCFTPKIRQILDYTQYNQRHQTLQSSLFRSLAGSGGIELSPGTTMIPEKLKEDKNESLDIPLAKVEDHNQSRSRGTSGLLTPPPEEESGSSNSSEAGTSDSFF